MINISVAILEGLYVAIELSLGVIFTIHTVSDALDLSDTFIKSLYESIYNGLFDISDTYIFPLNKYRLHEYTLFGKILFMTLWVIIFGIPFIFSIILSFIVLFLIKIFRKSCYKY